MAKKTVKPVQQLKRETDRLAVQAEKTKQQMDKVQEVADVVVDKAASVKRAKGK